MKHLKTLTIFITLLTYTAVTLYPLGKFPRRIDATQFLKNPQSFVDFCNILKETQVEYVIANRKLIGSPRTIFAPTDEAFRTFGLLGVIKKEKNRKKLLKDLVNNHIIKRRISPEDIQKNMSYKNYKTEANTRIALKDFTPFILYSVETETAIIHVINQILIPKTFYNNYTLKKYLK